MTSRTLSLIALVAFAPACSSADDTTSNEIDSSTAIDSTTDSDDANDGAEDSALDSATGDTTVVDTGAAPSDSGYPDVSVDGSDDVTDATSDAADASADAACKSGAIEERDCGKCGKQSRLCDKGAWLDWGLCGDETGECVPGEMRDGACGRCGTRKETCTATCAWSFGTCSGEGGCSAGATETQYGACLDAAQVKTRTCSDTCAWTDWSDCH